MVGWPYGRARVRGGGRTGRDGRGEADGADGTGRARRGGRGTGEADGTGGTGRSAGPVAAGACRGRAGPRGAVDQRVREVFAAASSPSRASHRA
ncbi:hypothetical protein Slala05_01470 [Streptomyces lavendulae subsp. lavendulae]|nr:hypothetical protein Slala05_01470 [Streptomyces lavendulae subsp. lavendulae]